MCSGEAGLARLSLLDLAQEECPYVDLPSDKSDGDRWELFLSEYSKKMRSNVRYYDRALDKIYEVDRRIASTPEEVDETFKSLLVLHQRRWNQRWLPGAFFAKSTQEFHSAVAPKLLERNWLRLHYLTLDGTTEAVLYCFSFNGVTSYYQGGFEPSLAKLSLGTVITGLAIRQALTDGNKTFDFLRGDEPYKRRWTKGSSAWNHRWILARRGTLLFSLIAVIIRFELRVEQGFKQWMHHRKKTPDTSAVAKLET
jgi:CelD/BcsL family acetyltransferase involved in cellulose biosynthesis